MLREQLGDTQLADIETRARSRCCATSSCPKAGWPTTARRAGQGAAEAVARMPCAQPAPGGTLGAMIPLTLARSVVAACAELWCRWNRSLATVRARAPAGVRTATVCQRPLPPLLGHYLATRIRGSSRHQTHRLGLPFPLSARPGWRFTATPPARLPAPCSARPAACSSPAASATCPRLSTATPPTPSAAAAPRPGASPSCCGCGCCASRSETPARPRRAKLCRLRRLLPVFSHRGTEAQRRGEQEPRIDANARECTRKWIKRVE